MTSMYITVDVIFRYIEHLTKSSGCDWLIIDHVMLNLHYTEENDRVQWNVPLYLLAVYFCT